ncbi:MAG: diguanylate cyclase domain-containing protein [Solirubrobacteraceae bacterium]
MRTLWFGIPRYVDASVQRLLTAARERPMQSLTGRELRVEVFFAALFVLVAVALMALAPSPQALSVPTAVALTLSYAIASRVEFESGVGSTVPTQLVFVPMLFFLPTAAVPLFVAAGLLLGRLPRYLTGYTPVNRAVVELGDALYCVGPVLVFVLAGADTPAFGDWPVYLLALAAQFVGDVAGSSARLRLGLGTPPRLAVRELGWIYVADTLLSSVGLLASFATVVYPYAFLLVLPLIGLLMVLARDRSLRIEQSVELSTAYRGSALLLDRVIAADDRLTGEHGRGVVNLAIQVGDDLGMAGEDRVELEFAALLHDVGKIAIDNEIINRRGPLTQEEFTAIKTHTIEAHHMLAEVGGLLGRVGSIVRSCHERWDGAGYPDGLAGEDIPLVARVVFCCDAFHAMTTDRSYRAARSPERALAELQAHAGSQFDPAVVEVLTRMVSTVEGASSGGGSRFNRTADGRRRQVNISHTELPPVSSDEGLVGLRPDGTVHSMNSAAVRLLGWNADQAIGYRVHDLVHHSYPNGTPYPRGASPIEAALRDGSERTGEVDVFWRKDGAAVGVRYDLRPSTDHGEPAGSVLHFKPLVARSRAEEALRLGEELYRSLARNLHRSTVLLFDHELRLLVAEGEVLARRDLEYDTLSGRKLEGVLPPHAWKQLQQSARAALQGERHDIDYTSEDGGRFYRITFGPVRDDQGAVQAGLAVAEDVTESRHRAERLSHLANHDELTGLTNRAGFHQVADKALRRAKRVESRAALLFVDLDGLKTVNDTLGHEEGDELLRAVAERLERAVREVDTVARLGGDEFAVLLENVQDEMEAAAAANRMIFAIAEPLKLGTVKPTVVTASIGIAMQSAPDETGAQLLGAADAAMYRAKGLGGNRYHFFDAASDLKLRSG